MKKPLSYSVPLVLFALTFWFTINNLHALTLISFFCMFGYILIMVFNKKNLEDSDDFGAASAGLITDETGRSVYQVFHGDSLNFTDEQLAGILTKRFPYFLRLDSYRQKLFLQRLQDFIADKKFTIYGGTAYKEMPVLISAAAIQLTFGLQKYLLPYFSSIHVYPQEFLRINNDICFLEGNVSGHTINLSWKHFLDGYKFPADGQNVGLHEMAHALYYQTFVTEENVDANFRDSYRYFEADADKAYQTERNMDDAGLYSEYAEKNFQEFWAETVELFFEKPTALRTSYPRLFATMKQLLNQDPTA